MDRGLSRIFPGEGEVAQLARSRAWTGTPLGDPVGWEPALLPLLRILLSSPRPVLLYWGPHRLQFFNDAFARILGIEPDADALGARGEEHWPELWKEIGGHIERAYAGAASANHLDRDRVSISSLGRRGVEGGGETIGEEGVWSFACTPIPDERGTVLGVFVSWIETSLQGEIAVADRRGEQRFRQLAESMPLIVWTANPDGDVDYQTRAVLDYTGCEPEQLAGAKWFDVLHPDDWAHTAAAWTTSFATGEPYQVEFRIRRRDGMYRWFLTRAVPFRNEDGEILKWYGSTVDVHDLRESALRIQEQAELLERARDAIMVRDLDHTVIYWNAGAERLYGWGREEAVGQTTLDLIHEDPDQFERATLEVLQKGEWVGEIQQVCKDGSKVTVEGRWSLIVDEEGVPSRILTINTDITERKKIFGQFLRAQRMESIGTLAGGIAHDLNNVLTPILLSTQLLKGEIADGEQREILRTIETSAERGAAMVKQVLSFARGIEGVQIAVDLVRIVSDLGRVVRDTFPKNISFENEVRGGLLRLVGDPTQIHQVLMNLFVNARDAMPSGGVLSVSAENVALDEAYMVQSGQGSPGSFVCISVADTGTGMPEEILLRIFDPFFTTKPVGEGTGLGLSTVQAIMKTHGGFVNVYSELGSGTTFRVYLPAAAGDDRPGDELLVPEPARGNGELVLVVDDESSVREVTRQTLEAFGYRVLTATDGADAVATYARNAEGIALVLTDIMMPVMDGPATIRALTRMNPKVRIVAASGLGTNSGVAQAVNAGVRHFLSKPFTAASLLRKVREVLDEA